jgi:hypothetical protein
MRGDVGQTGLSLQATILIGWSRVLTGTFRDPVVGRDVLIGMVGGALTVCLWWLVYAEGAWLGLQVASWLRPALESFREPRHFAGLIIFLHTGNLGNALAALFVLAALDRFFRARWLAVVAWSGILMVLSWPPLVWARTGELLFKRISHRPSSLPHSCVGAARLLWPPCCSRETC